jgi:hypothetical protein
MLAHRPFSYGLAGDALTQVKSLLEREPYGAIDHAGGMVVDCASPLPVAELLEDVADRLRHFRCG